MTLKTESVRLPSVVSFCVSSDSNPEAVHELSSSQEFYGHRWVTLTPHDLESRIGIKWT